MGEFHTLQTLLTAPVYEFEAYENYISEIANSTPETNPRIHEVLRSQGIVATNAFKIEQRILTSSNCIVVGRIQSRFGWDNKESLVKVGRSLVGEYEISKFSIDEETLKDSHHLILFNDSFLVASKTKAQSLISLDECELIKSKGKKKIQSTFFFDDTCTFRYLTESCYTQFVVGGSKTYTIKTHSEKDTNELEESLQNELNSHWNQYRVYGIDYVIILKREKSSTGVPNFITQLAKTLSEPKHIQTEGIFRISPVQNDIKDQIKVINEGKHVTLGNMNPHILAALFKMWWRALPNPIITADFLRQAVTHSKAAKEMRMKFVREHVRDLHESDLVLLKFLCRFLFLVSRESAKNKMTLENLTICWTPTIFRSQVESAVKNLLNNKLIPFALTGFFTPPIHPSLLRRTLLPLELLLRFL